MIEQRSVVLDANSLLRAVLGNRVETPLKTYRKTGSFFTPALCFVEARRSLIAISEDRRMDLGANLYQLESLKDGIWQVDATEYVDFKPRALARIASRDPSDWPIVATALLLNCPIWTEDRGFFGTGIATWTSSRVEIYLRGERVLF